MAKEFATLSHIRLNPGTSPVRPPEPPRLVHLDDPALEVMTDFRIVHAVTISPAVSIDEALETMKTRGVRLLLVTAENDHILGLITPRTSRARSRLRLRKRPASPIARSPSKPS